MDHPARRLLDQFSDNPGSVELREFFEDNSTGCGCRAFYLLHDGRKRRVLVRVSEEFADDELQTHRGVEKAKTLIERHLASVHERIKDQTEKLVREPDYVLSH